MKKLKILALLLVFAMCLSLFGACGSGSTTSSTDDTDTTAETETTEVEEEDTSAEDAASSEDAAQESDESQEDTEAEASEPAAASDEAEAEAEETGEMTTEEQVAAVAAMEIENTHSLPLTEDDVTFTLWTDFIPPLFNYMPNGNADNYVYAELEERTGVTLDITSVSLTDASTNVSLLITSGDYPDIWYGFGSYYSNSMDEAVEEDLIYDLADYKEYFPAFFSIVDNYDIYAKNAYTDEGTLGVLVGIWTNSVIDAGLTIRQDWLDELGLEVPTTLGEVYDVLVQFNNEYGAVYYMSQDSSDPVNTFSQAFGVSSYAQSGATYAYYIAQDGETVAFSPQLDGFREYLELMNQLYSEGLIYADFLSASDSVPSSDLWLDGRVGLSYYTTSNYTTLMSQVDEGSNFDITAISVPVEEEGDSVHLGRAVDYASTKGFSLSTNLDDSSEEFRIACEMMDYLYTDEGSELCNYGIEGVTFTYDDDGNHVWTELMTDNPEGLAYSWCLNRYTLGAGSFRIESSRTLNEYGEGEMAMINAWNNTENDAADLLPTALSLTAEESYGYSALFGDISTHVQENILSFITGTRSLDEYDDFLAEIEGMGIDTCTEILQAALERYNAR